MCHGAPWVSGVAGHWASGLAATGQHLEVVMALLWFFRYETRVQRRHSDSKRRFQGSTFPSMASLHHALGVGPSGPEQVCVICSEARSQICTREGLPSERSLKLEAATATCRHMQALLASNRESTRLACESEKQLESTDVCRPHTRHHTYNFLERGLRLGKELCCPRSLHGLQHLVDACSHRAAVSPNLLASFLYVIEVLYYPLVNYSLEIVVRAPNLQLRSTQAEMARMICKVSVICSGV